MPPPESDVEAATLAPTGPPPITRITFPTCRAQYPGGSSGCACRFLPHSCSLPNWVGWSASALSLSRPAQASLTLPPARSLSRPRATFVTRLRPGRLPDRTARQLPAQSTTLWVDSSSTGDSRLRGALPGADNSLQALGAAGPLAWAAALVLAGYSHSGRPAFRSPSSNLAICSGRHGIRSLTSDIRYGESSSRMRATAFCACSSRPASAWAAATARNAGA